MEVCLASRELSCWLEKLMESYSLDKTKTKTNKETAHERTQGAHLCLLHLSFSRQKLSLSHSTHA